VVLTARTGRHGLRDRLKKLGYALPQEELNRTYQRFLMVADKKQEVFDEDLIAILHFDDGQQFLVAVGESGLGVGIENHRHSSSSMRSRCLISRWSSRSPPNALIQGFSSGPPACGSSWSAKRAGGS
jgi:hypothetical protein